MPDKVYLPEDWDEIRQERIGIDGNQCANCGSTGILQVHHIVSKQHGGTDELSNLRTLCTECHGNAHGGSIGWIGTSKEHYKETRTRWLPSMRDASYFIQNVNHPLEKAVLMIFLKTGIGLEELAQVNCNDLYFTEFGCELTSTLERYNRPFLFVEQNDLRRGTSKRLCNTYIPLDKELETALKRWLLIRPDTDYENLFVYTSGDWGMPVTTQAMRNMVNKNGERLGLREESNEPENRFTPSCLMKFFENRYNGHPAVRDYILGKKKAAPFEKDHIITDYRESVFKLT